MLVQTHSWLTECFKCEHPHKFVRSVDTFGEQNHIVQHDVYLTTLHANGQEYKPLAKQRCPPL